jgi:hypothetical protein
MVRIVLGSVLTAVLAVGAQADWRPGANPDPRRILREAREDAAAGRYEDALAKHLWFHENALKLAPNLDGVRLSFALAYWNRLGASYPPALERLRRIRDDLREDIRNAKETRAADVRRAFHELAAINRELSNDAGTVALFLWLDANRPPLAKVAYDLAESALIAANEYAVCGRYLDKTTFPRLLSARQKSLTEAAAAGRLPPDELNRFNEFVETVFALRTATLVALLVRNNRKAEARQIVLAAQKVRGDAAFRAQLAKALKGEVPQGDGRR